MATSSDALLLANLELDSGPSAVQKEAGGDFQITERIAASHLLVALLDVPGLVRPELQDLLRRIWPGPEA